SDIYTNISGSIGGFALSNLIRINNTSYTAQFTITNGGTDVPAGTDIPVSLTIDDSSANTSASYTTAISQSSDAIDATAPLVTDGNISISGATGLGGAYKVGDTIIATWNNTAGGDNNSDTISAVAGNFSAFGGGTEGAASNSLDTWTASYTITDGGGSIDGSNLNVAVTATDDAGNVTITADTTNATVDNDSPILSSSTPTDNGTGVLLTDNIVLNFSDNIALGTGNIVISDGAQTITIDVANHSDQLTVSENTLTINPTADLANSAANYSVQIAATAIDDNAGNSFAGIADSTTLDFTTVDTSIVVFDLTDGNTSSHSSRIFDGDTTYSIYIKVATNAVGISVTNLWTGADNLGSDDTIIIVGSGAAPLGQNGAPAASKGATASAMVWSNPALVSLNKGGGITTFRMSGMDTADLWDGNWVGTLLQGGAILTILPGSVATSQGV
ncbi:MAG: Ig-like domain-containing protein, partial [Bermanella sp.]